MKMSPPLATASYPDFDVPLSKDTLRRSLSSVREDIPTVNRGGGNYKPYEQNIRSNGINGNPSHKKCDSKISVEDTLNNDFTFPSRSATTTTTTNNTNHDRTNPQSPHNRSNPQHSHHPSRVSVSSKASSKSHQEYINSLAMPPPEVIRKINHVQEEKEKEAIAKRLGDDPNLSENERWKAAELIQRNYRGHRERRILAGKRLDVGTRWVEAVKEARYRNLTTPRARESGEKERGSRSLDGEGHSSMNTEGVGSPTSTTTNRTSHARENWRKIGMIARRAGGDEESDEGSDHESGDLNEEELIARRKRRVEEKAARQKAAKIMDLQYFLEMVDLKHRYGSNLRTYHEEWKKADTNENFFYWLDYGEGRFIDCQGCPRERLDREQVRYLSKEERLDYLVKIDEEGRLCWAKNGERIDTTTEWRDSIRGIVRNDDETPVFTPVSEEGDNGGEEESESSSDESPLHHNSHTRTQSQSQVQELEVQREESRASKYASPEYDNAPAMKKVSHMSASTIFNKLLRGSVKKNTWIFVADTSFRLYVGIKQSGAFQHSSFLHGSRISAAGLIKIKDGRLTKLSPLSGHYRPPVSNFRAFVKNLKTEGCDMSRVSISRSYAVLVGLEAYVKTRKRAKKVMGKVVRRRDKMLDKEGVVRRDEEMEDKCESAEKEVLEEEQKRKDDQRLGLWAGG
ncbi:7abfa553-b78b-44e6-b871-8d031b028933 [Sclerotinia trifoliorum]|uniref:7abfa553-b78b-44e6-b871-8d031b028933 n=1 Tax=Sclerotinia trifoliorum TaxID=28548 RepID=A0A8H2VQ48_9HELO|nr:7abfa553-b78b-44e6-b871-8d031b028933 [Sclerotinia trifoliorum]